MVEELEGTSYSKLKAQLDVMSSAMKLAEDRVEQRMAHMKDELDAQNRLLLSKISAVSTLHQSAPGIFAGADRRKREIQGIQQFGTPAMRHTQLSFFDMFERLPSHQEALARGMLTQYTSEIAGRVIFVSHEWLSLTHADPDGDQLRELQRLLIRMMKGAVHPVKSQGVKHSSNAATKSGENTEEATADEWMAALPFAFVWLDFLSIPQPCMEPDSETASAQDHRHGLSAASKSAHQLALAVNSIPAYVRAASLMLVLTPFLKHKDRENLCSFQSWMRRGWCRLELATCLLATHALRVVACNGGEGTPHYVRSAEATRLPVGGGVFSCCDTDHDFGNGVKVRCDKAKIRPVLVKMLNDGVRYYKQQDDNVMTRFLMSFGWIYLQELPVPSHDAHPQWSKLRLEGGLEDWRKRLYYGNYGKGEEWERAYTDTSGTTILFYLVMAQCLRAVEECVAQPTFNPKDIFSKSTLGNVEKDHPPGLDSMFVSMISPSFGIAGTLIKRADEAGLRADIPIHSILLAGILGRHNNIRKWLELFPAHSCNANYPKPGGLILQYCRVGTVEAVKALLDTGAELETGPGYDPMHMCAINYRHGGEICKFLLEVGDPGVINRVKCNIVPKALLAGSASPSERRSLLGRLFLPKKHQVKPKATVQHHPTEGDSPLHSAIRSGNVSMMTALLQQQPNGSNADLSLRNAAGQTASDLVRAEYNNTMPKALSELLRSAAYYNSSVLGNPVRKKQTAITTPVDSMKNEREEFLRTIRAKDQQMVEALREKDKELASTRKEMAEAMRDLKDSLRDDIRQEMASILEAKEQEIAMLRNTKGGTEEQGRERNLVGPAYASAVYGR